MSNSFRNNCFIQHLFFPDKGTFINYNTIVAIGVIQSSFIQRISDTDCFCCVAAFVSAISRKLDWQTNHVKVTSISTYSEALRLLCQRIIQECRLLTPELKVRRTF